MFRVLLAILLALASTTTTRADIYMHNPRGSNNRLDESSRERRNDNRLFDSQNNNRGGYLQGYMAYYAGSILNIEWTNQHSCNSSNADCDIIIQYMCSDYIRDGTTLTTIPQSDSQCEGKNCTTDFKYGMNEDKRYYDTCKTRSRNLRLFTADQALGGKSAIYTRQNPNGKRFGYECPEERDYYPYWAPTGWVDIAILTNDVTKCARYLNESENVKGRWFCEFAPNKPVDIIPIDSDTCLAKGGTWKQSPAHNITAPTCHETFFTRDNHLGDTLGGHPPYFKWALPDKSSDRCVLRIRYNISTNEIKQLNQENGVNIAKLMNLTQEQANKRGYVFKNNPTVNIFDDLDFGLNLAINTAQYGRVFEDRSFMFSIKERDFEPDKKVHNLNVRGKRGNIVQVYPSVEYDFVPNQLEASLNDYIHIQWTGSNKNPPNNDGQGLAGSDRSNLVMLRTNQNGPRNTYFDPLTQYGTYSVNYPEYFSNTTFLGLSYEDLVQLAFLGKNRFSDSGLLNNAATYFDLGVRKISTSGVYHYMCTRNNDFSNRDQKARIIAYDHEFEDAFVGRMGGIIRFSSGKIEIPQEAFSQLNYIRVELNSAEKKNPFKDNFPDSSLGTDFLTLDTLDSSPNKPIKFSLRLKRSASAFQSSSVYRITSSSGVFSKIESQVGDDNQVAFESYQSGTYVLKHESNVSAIVGLSIGLVALVVIIGAVVFLVVWKKPAFLTSLRYRARNLERSVRNTL